MKIGKFLDWLSSLFPEDDSEDNELTYGSEHYRLAQWFPWVAYDEETQLFGIEEIVNNKRKEKLTIDALGYVIELTPQIGANSQMTDMLTNVYKDLPAGCGVQIQLYGSPIIDQYLADYKGCINTSGMTEGQRKIVTELADIRAAHYRMGTRESLVGSRPYLLRNIRCIVSVTFPGADFSDEATLEKIKIIRNSHIETLKTYSLFDKIWNAEDFINWINTIVNGQMKDFTHLNYDPGAEIRDQVMSPATTMKVRDKDWIVGDKKRREIVIRTMSLRSYPKKFHLSQMINLLGDQRTGAMGYNCPYLISLNVRTKEFEAMQNKVAIKQARATQLAEGQMGKFLPELHDKRRDWDIMQLAYTEGSGSVEMFHQLVLFPEVGSVEKAESAAKATWRAAGFDLETDENLQCPSFLSSLPLMMTNQFQKDCGTFKKWTQKTTFNAVHMMPIIAEWNGINIHNPIISLSGKNGQVMGVDLFENNSGNYNAIVVGTSGSGKSFFMNDIAKQYFAAGGRVWIIDVGRSFEKLCHNLGGQYIEFKPEKNICVNPFPMIENLDEEMEMIKPLLSQMISPSRALTDYELSQVEINLRLVWEEKGKQTTITDIQQRLMRACPQGGYKESSMDDDGESCDPRIRDLAVQLFPYTEDGAYGKYFTGMPNVDFDSNFVVLELEELNGKKDLQAVIMFLLMYKITKEMYEAPRNQKKIVIIDEAWDLMGAGNSGDFIEKGYRRARKYGGAFITGTQSINDYFMSKPATAAFENSDWMFLLRQKPESIEALKNSGKLHMDDHMEQLLRSITTRAGFYSEVFIKAGQAGYGVGTMIGDPYSQILYSSKAEDYEAVQEYVRAGADYVTAIKSVVRDRANRKFH